MNGVHLPGAAQSPAALNQTGHPCVLPAKLPVCPATWSEHQVPVQKGRCVSQASSRRAGSPDLREL